LLLTCQIVFLAPTHGAHAQKRNGGAEAHSPDIKYDCGTHQNQVQVHERSSLCHFHLGSAEDVL